MAPAGTTETHAHLLRVAAVLAEVGRARSLEGALAALGRGALSLLGGAQAAVRAYGVDNQGTNLAYWVSPDGRLTPAGVTDPPATSVAGQLRAGGPPRIIRDLWALDPGDSPLYPQLRQRGLRASIAVPIVAEGERIGSLHVDHPTVGYYSELHLALAEALAIQAGAAIERVRQRARRADADRVRALYEDAREQNESHVALNASLRDLAEENARLLAEAREALRARDDFLNAAAHELKTPMTSIMGHVQLAQRRAAAGRPRSPEDAARLLTRVGAQTARLSRVVEQLLAGAQLQAGELAVFPRATDLGDLVGEAIDLLMADPAEHEIQTRLPAKPMMLSVDPQLMRHAVLAVLDNALRARRASPTAPLSVVEVGLRGRGGAAVLTVRDHGMPLDDLPQTLDGISRERNTLQLTGLGLGLVVARRVVEQHGGQITAARPRGGGTLVSIVLPLSRQ